MAVIRISSKENKYNAVDPDKLTELLQEKQAQPKQTIHLQEEDIVLKLKEQQHQPDMRFIKDMILSRKQKQFSNLVMYRILLEESILKNYSRVVFKKKYLDYTE